MAICGKCSAEIDHLLCHQKIEWRLSSGGSYELLEMFLEWVCPTCTEVLFSGLEKEAEVVEWLAL